MKVEVQMPKMGESITEGRILKWLKKPGDAVDRDETVPSLEASGQLVLVGADRRRDPHERDQREGGEAGNGGLAHRWAVPQRHMPGSR